MEKEMRKERTMARARKPMMSTILHLDRILASAHQESRRIAMDLQPSTAKSVIPTCVLVAGTLCIISMEHDVAPRVRPASSIFRSQLRPCSGTLCARNHRCKRCRKKLPKKVSTFYHCHLLCHDHDNIITMQLLLSLRPGVLGQPPDSLPYLICLIGKSFIFPPECCAYHYDVSCDSDCATEAAKKSKKRTAKKGKKSKRSQPESQ